MVILAHAGILHAVMLPLVLATRRSIKDAMNKAFVKETSSDDDDEAPDAPALPSGSPNYMTVVGHAAIRAEFEQLVKIDRPEIVKIVSWAAGNGDRSENGDYIYGKKRMREIDKRIRFLSKRLDTAVVVDPANQENFDQVFFGATVAIVDADGKEFCYQIVGIDEANAASGKISWISPLARALLKARVDETVRFQSPLGWREVDVLRISYV